MSISMNPEDVHHELEDKDIEETNEISSDEEGKKTGTHSKKRSSPEEPADDDKKAERRAANRRSAFQSRQRRKILIEDLQRTVNALSKDNGDLRKTNEDLRVQLEATLVENHQFRMQQQMSGHGNASTGFMGNSALQSAQVQALLRSGGQAALAQLLSSSGAPSMSATPGSICGGASNDAQDPLVNARLALAAAKTRSVDKLNQSQGSTSGSTHSSAENQGTSSPTSSSSQPTQNGIQGILNAASMANSASGPTGLTGLQSLLQNHAMCNPHLAGLHQGLAPGGAQLAGLQGLLDQLRGGSIAGGAQPGLTDIQRALMHGQEKINVSDALRSLLQKN